MPTFVDHETEIYYEEFGDGFPLLLFAPGGMRSAIAFWENSPWNPIETLAPNFRIIAMDQRNAGQSRAPISGEDSWSTYTRDHLALLDHLKIERTHLLGGCIGGPYCLGVMEAAPERIAAAVLQQPIGFDNNRPAFYEMFDGWARDLRDQCPNMTPEDWSRFRGNMYDGDFVFNVSRAFVEACSIPMLVLMGDDLYHPQSTSREIVHLAPRATLIEEWKTPESVPFTIESVKRFLMENADSP